MGRKQACAIWAGTIAKVETGVAQLIAGRRPEAASWVNVAREVEWRNHLRSLWAAGMANRMGVPLDVRRYEGRFCLPERIEHELLNRHPIALAGDDLDQPSEQDEPDVVVAEISSEGGHLRVCGKALHDVTGDRVVAAAGIDDVIGPPSAGMGQQVPYRQPGGDILVHEPKVWQVVADRRVEVEFAETDQAHDRRAGVGLGQRADL